MKTLKYQNVDVLSSPPHSQDIKPLDLDYNQIQHKILQI